MLAAVALRDDLDRRRAAARALAEDGEELAGVVPAEPQRGRAHVSLRVRDGGEERTWLVLDDDGRRSTDRDAVRRTAVRSRRMCELAEESAGGGELDELRERLVALRLTESPPGIEEAEEAALALEQAIGAPPRVASLRTSTASALRRAGSRTRSAIPGCRRSPRR